MFKGLVGHTEKMCYDPGSAARQANTASLGQRDGVYCQQQYLAIITENLSREIRELGSNHCSNLTVNGRKIYLKIHELGSNHCSNLTVHGRKIYL